MSRYLDQETATFLVFEFASSIADLAKLLKNKTVFCVTIKL